MFFNRYTAFNLNIKILGSFLGIILRFVRMLSDNLSLLSIIYSMPWYSILIYRENYIRYQKTKFCTIFRNYSFDPRNFKIGPTQFISSPREKKNILEPKNITIC